jgi:hypothetical protein
VSRNIVIKSLTERTIQNIYLEESSEPDYQEIRNSFVFHGEPSGIIAHRWESIITPKITKMDSSQHWAS